MFGSHVAPVLRRLRRVCAHYGADPVFVLASATVSDPAVSAGRLAGAAGRRGDRRRAPRAARLLFALWEPPLTELAGEHGAPVRRTATAEAADLLADLVADGRPDGRLRAVPARRRDGRRSTARRLLAEVDPELAARVAAYRAGYLPEERRALEADLQSGGCSGVAATNALELGVDIAGLDAVLLAGYPGTRASLWQQAGRAGRAGQGALAVLVARDDPLDTYLTHHPETLFGRPVEATVLDPDNPYVLAPAPVRGRRRAAAAPTTTSRCSGRTPRRSLDAPGRARAAAPPRRPGWFWTRRERASDLADIRGAGRPAGRAGRGGHRPAARHGRRRGRARDRARRRGLPAPGRDATSSTSLDLERRTWRWCAPADPDWTTSPATSPTSGSLETHARQSWGAVDAVASAPSR